MKTSTTKKIRTIPSSFQGILWSVNVKNLDLEKDKVYIIHQVLSYGTLEQIRWLFEVYSKREIKRVFEASPMKVYNFPTFNFIKNIVLGLKEKPFSSKDYVSSIY
ncbi:MAG: hypothetical protein KY055_02690 [Candidatus Nealsonbacteria bacterium]|nr:hypothetical protein [Candidatus Nealsonbacteria bacterium]